VALKDERRARHRPWSRERAALVRISAEESNMNETIVEELTNRLPTAELVKIIKGALECGRRNVPFTESDLLRAMTFGVNSTYVRSSGGNSPRHPERTAPRPMSRR
jgi:hypothetical protein